jgi:predicted kinase
MRLILLNGPPAIGKSTLARRYVADNPLALCLDIDEIRCRLGQWDSHPQSKSLARTLGLQMTRTHLASGYQVVVPQLLLRTEFIEELAAAAAEAQAPFTEIVLLAPTLDDAIVRFQQAQKALAASGIQHPRQAVADEIEAVSVSYERLRTLAKQRPQNKVLCTSYDDIEDSYRSMRRMIDGRESPTLPSGSASGT